MDSYCGKAEYLQNLAAKMTNDHTLFSVVCELNRHFREGHDGKPCHHPENPFVHFVEADEAKRP